MAIKRLVPVKEDGSVSYVFKHPQQQPITYVIDLSMVRKDKVYINAEISDITLSYTRVLPVNNGLEYPELTIENLVKGHEYQITLKGEDGLEFSFKVQCL